MTSKSFLKPNPLTRIASAIAVSLLSATATMHATVLFSDNFNDASSNANYTVNYAPVANAANQDAVFAFDYSAFGIPAAPGSADTLGLRLRSNIPGGAASPVTTRPAGTTSGLSISPTGKDFGTNYHVSFYAWANFNGTGANATGLADNGTSEGGTHNILFSIGTSGTVPLVVGNTGLASGASMDGIGFATTGDGGITLDYRVYPKSGTIVNSNNTALVVSPNIGVYAAGTNGDAIANTGAYYQRIPSLAPHTAPTVQQSLSTAEYGSDAFNTQLGSTQIGSFGFAWHRVDLYRYGNIAKWSIDSTPIATLDFTSLLPLGGNNFAIGDSDVNTTTTRHPSLLFSLIDNLVVSDLTDIPALTTTHTSTNALLSWPEASGGGFSLQYTTGFTNSGTGWSTVTNAITNFNGTASAAVPTTNAQTFFRLKLP